MTIHVVLGDDNVLVREGVRALLSATEEIEVVAVAHDAPSLMEAVEEQRPDVVVTDIKMPPNFQLEGIEAAHQIRRQFPGTGVVVLSAHDDEAYAMALLGGGEGGLAYLVKDRLAQGDELFRAIREVAAGRSAIDATIAARLSGDADRPQDDQHVLSLMAAGQSYEEMAQSLGTTQEELDRRVVAMFQRLAIEVEGGRSHAVDAIRRLHSAVVDREASARTLRSFVPVQFADRLAAGALPTAQEEVEVTILFSDVRGFSALAEQLPPRELSHILARHLGAMAEVVLEHGGTIDKFAGDAVMAVFGAPDPQPDHAERALRCAIAMQARQRQLNLQADEGSATRLGIGIGINTGTVMAGTIGGGGRLEYTVVGDSVNVAQRINAEAAEGEILATQSTVASAPRVPAVAVGARTVKGRREAVVAYRVLFTDIS